MREPPASRQKGGYAMRSSIWPSSIIRRAAAPLAAACLLLLLAGPVQAIVGGQPDGNRHPYVGAFFQNGRFACSGELVSATKVLSAAHCAELGFNTSSAPVTFTLDPNATSSSTFYPVAGWVIMPGFSGNSDSPGSWPHYHNDLLMVTLGKAVKNVTPVTLPGLGYLDTLNLRTQTFTLVGYGTPGLHGGVPGPYGTRMYTDVSAKKGQSISVSDEYLQVSGMGSSSGGCFGDSGGAALAGNTLVATITGGNGFTCSDWTYATRVDTQAAIDFIRQNL
jgi:hypothetical protein